MQRAIGGILAAWLLVGCRGSAPEDFGRMARSEAGQRRIAAWVADVSHPMDRRVDALVTVAAEGFPGRVRGMVEGAPDREALAERTAAALVERLPPRFQAPEEAAYLREALMAVLLHVPDDRRLPIQQALARWVFGSLTLDSSAEETKQQVEPRLPIHQLPLLGLPGAKGATVLVRHGFSADAVARYVLSQPDPEAHRMLLEAFRRLHRTPDLEIPASHLEAIGDIRDPSAAVYLLDLAQDRNQSSEIRAIAFNEAADLMEDPALAAGNREALADRLRSLMQSGDPDDRWSAANFLFRLEGESALPVILQGMKDDGVWPNATEDPMKSMVDFCKGTFWKGDANPGKWSAVQGMIQSGNRVHRTLGLICLKASQDPSRAGLARRSLGSRADLFPVLGVRLREDVLAKNVTEGLQMFAELARDEAAGRLDAADAKRLRFIVLVNLTDTGRTYRLAVADRFKAERAP